MSMNSYPHESSENRSMFSRGSELKNPSEDKNGEQTFTVALVERMLVRIDRKLEYIAAQVDNYPSSEEISSQQILGQFQPSRSLSHLGGSGRGTPTKGHAPTSNYLEVAENALSPKRMNDVLERVRRRRRGPIPPARSLSNLSSGIQQVKSAPSIRTSGEGSVESFALKSLPDSLVAETSTSNLQKNMAITQANTHQSSTSDLHSRVQQLSSCASSCGKFRMVDGVIEHNSTDLSVNQQLEHLREAIQKYTIHHRGDVRTAVWTFLEHPFSGKWALLYSIFVPVFICSSVAASFLQTVDGNPIPEDVGAVLSIIVESFFVLELCIRFVVCPDQRGFWLNIFNYIDLLSALPLFVRITVSIISATTGSQGDAVLAFIQVSPLLRLLKLTRRFEKFQLLLSAFEIAVEALPVLLYTLFLLALIFSACLNWVEPAENIGSLPTALWLALVTMTTVGYGDIVPESVAGYVVIMLLMIISALYMAIPIGIVGTAFSQVWNDRDRLLLMTRMRDAFAQAGFTAEAINEIVQLFDPDCSGRFGISEFCVMMKVMHISLTPDRIIQAFENLDKSARGFIRVQDLVDGIFPGANMDLTYFKENHESERSDIADATNSAIPNSIVQQDLCQGLDVIRSISLGKEKYNKTDDSSHTEQIERDPLPENIQKSETDVPVEIGANRSQNATQEVAKRLAII